MKRLGRLVALVLCVVLAGWLVPSTASAIPGFSDCKDSPVPEMPGRGVAGFFAGEPDDLPPAGDPFEAESTTTIYEQYGYAGLRWHTYDLGCGPDATRHPEAVIGTAVSNWLMQLPIALTAMTGSITQAAFAPTFLSAFDSSLEGVSTALHDSLFVSWIPFVFAALGLLIIFKARRASMASSAAAVGWALIVVLIAAALFRWPVEAGRAADATVTETLGAVVSRLDGNGSDIDPGTAVASSVNESILYRVWVAGTLGSPDSRTARKYGPALFDAHALTWREARVLERDPDRGKEIIEHKQEQWETVADKIEDEDPEAYEYLQGMHSETRVGYAILATLGVFFALPFLLMSALLLIGCFLIVRLAVMFFPAFATLGAFPATRGLITGLGRIVGAAVVNSIVFGIGAGITIALLGILMQPGGGAPSWLGIVLMPLFSFIMWTALKPFRQLTSMVSPQDSLVRRTHRPSWVRRLTYAGVSAATGGTAAGIAAGIVSNGEETPEPPDAPDRAEARPSTVREPEKSPVGELGTARAETPAIAGPSPSGPQEPLRRGPRPGRGDGPRHRDPEGGGPSPEQPFAPIDVEETIEPAHRREYDGDEVYVIYRPEDDQAEAGRRE